MAEITFKIDPELTIQNKRQYAEQLLKNPIIEHLFKDVRKQTISQWERCAIEDVDGKEFLWTSLQVLNKLRFTLDGYIANALLEDERNKNKLQEE